jgi:hypothetical protein
MRDSALEKGVIPTISRSEQSNRAQIRAETIEMLILSVKSRRHGPICLLNFLSLSGVVLRPLWVAVVVMGFLLHGRRVSY